MKLPANPQFQGS